MKLILCLDDNNGMMFNKRRQSQDKNLRLSIKDTVKDHLLYMNNYSYKLYNDIDDGNIIVDESFLQKCENDNFALVEDLNLHDYINNIDLIIVYKWNRVYPSDKKLDINLKDNIWTLISSEDFQGSSHDKITKEIYRRK